MRMLLRLPSILDLLTCQRIMSTLDPKSRNLLEKDASNPHGGPRPAPALPAKSPAKSRTALQEAIAARKKAQMPSRPESAQPTFPEAKPPALAKSTRTVPTGAPLSSLSSAPMRPGMKPRRPEISRPATADPYARRPESRAQSTNPGSASKPTTSSPRSVRSKPSTPNAKPLTAPRIRPHESNPSGAAQGRPKKLDLSKSKSHNDLGAASRARSDSNDSLTNQPSARTPRTPRTPRYDSHLSAAEDQHSPAQRSPASAVFDSPELSASQPMLHSAPDGPHAGSVPVDEPEPMVLEEYAEPAVMPPSPRIAEPDVAAPIDPHLIPVPESVSKSVPDPMVIYEDPATPTTPTTPTRAQNVYSNSHLTPSRSSIPMRSPIRSPVRSPIRPEQPEQCEFEPESVPEDASASVMTSANKPPPELAASHDSVTNFEARTPSPTRRAPLQPTPSPTRGRVQPSASNIVTGVDSMDLQDTPVGSPETHGNESHGNNENATPHMGKVVDLSVPRSAAKPTALEEVTINESTPRSTDVRERSIEALSQSVLSNSDDSTRRTRKFNERHRSPSPRSKDPANAREMIHKAHARIVSRTMEPSGYRKLQALFQYHGEEIDVGVLARRA
jgi:CLIP-associating protein 1/2